MRFLIDHLPVSEQNRIRAKNAREMQQFINDNPIMAGTQIEGITYRPQNSKDETGDKTQCGRKLKLGDENHA